MNLAEQMQEAQQQMLREMQAAQERMIEMNDRIAGAVTQFTPRADSVETPSLPGLEDLPDPGELVDSYFDFQAKLAEANRVFYKQLMSAWTRDVADEQPAA